MPFDDTGMSANARAVTMLMRMEDGFRSGEWGWIQRAFKRKGGYCLAGAMDKVEGMHCRDMAEILGGTCQRL